MASLLDLILSPMKYIKKYLSSLEDNLSQRVSGDDIALIINTNLFKKMNNDELAQLVSSTHLKKFKAGTIILNEGDKGDALYVISEGNARVFIEDMDRKQIPLSILKPGSYFGEQAIYGNKVKTRNASVEALTDITLVSIKGKYLTKLVNHDESLKSTIEERKLSQSVNIIAHASIFQPELELLLSNLENPHVFEFHDKECIFKSGDPSEMVYMVIQGKVKLLIPQKNSDVFSELILNKGHLFGELGVMNNAPRAATAIAMGSVRLLGIDDREFMKDVSISTRFRSMLSNLQKLYSLPMSGAVEQYARYTPEDGNTIINIYTLDDGRVIQSSKALDKDVFSMVDTHNKNGTRHQFSEAERAIEVFVSNGRLTGIKASGNWESLPDLCYMLLESVKIDNNQIKSFEKTGNIVSG